jgi:hypothetical protein
MIARSQDRHGLNWLDDERIVFVGSKPGETRIERGQELPRTDLYVWNVSTGAIRREAELSSTSGICVAPGHVRYHFERDGVSYVRFGEFSRTHEVEVDVQAMKDGILAVSPVSCREYNPKLLKRRYGDWALPLLEPGEYLDRTSGQYAEPMRYFPSDGSAPIPLSKIPTRNVFPMPRYSEHLDKYVFNEQRNVTGSKIPARIWLLDRKGNTESASVRSGPWMAGYVELMPYRNGLVMSSRAGAFGGNEEAAGIYVVKDGQVALTKAGMPHAFVVSPDGCKVATSIDVDRKENARPTVWMIDLCAKGR